MEPSFLDTWTNLRDILLMEFIEQEQLKYVPFLFSLHKKKKKILITENIFSWMKLIIHELKSKPIFQFFKSNPIMIKGAEAWWHIFGFYIHNYLCFQGISSEECLTRFTGDGIKVVTQGLIPTNSTNKLGAVFWFGPPFLFSFRCSISSIILQIKTIL